MARQPSDPGPKVVPIVDDSLIAHKLASVELIRNTGAYAVKINANEKTPYGEWHPSANDKIKTELLLREAEKAQYDLNLGIHLVGNTVDLDIDSNDYFLQAALDKFLPHCNHIWGHSSRPRTHRLYQLKKDFNPHSPENKILGPIKRIPEVKLDLRGGPPAHGDYTLMPGSIHPSGEEVRWDNLKNARLTAVILDINDLTKAIRLAGAASVLAAHWIEGCRNELTMALTGFLHRTSKIAEALGDIDFLVNQDIARNFLAVMLDITDDTKETIGRFKTFDATWSKADSDAPVTGGATIAKITGNETILSKLYTLLCDSPDITILDEFTLRFVIWSGPGVVIDLESTQQGKDRPFMNRMQFNNSFGHRFIDRGEKRKLVSDLLFSLPTTTRVASLTFEPGKEQILETAEGKKVNQWIGFAIAPYSEAVSAAEIAPFLNYLQEIICSNNAQHYEWVLGWIAHIFKEPANKTGTALVLIGRPGIGKSFLGVNFLIPIIGNHAITTLTVDRVGAGFNAPFDNKIYIQCEEAVSNRQKQVAARLKSLITDPTFFIEHKGLDPISKPNHLRFLFTSNETRDAVFLSDGLEDRRYTILEVSPMKQGKIKEYWQPLAEWAKDEVNLAKIHRYLIDYNYSRLTITRPLNTKAKMIVQEHSMPAFDRWLSRWVARDHPLSEEAHKNWFDAPGVQGKSDEIFRVEWPERVSYNALVKDFNIFCKTEVGRLLSLNENQIGFELNNRFKITENPRLLKVKSFDSKEGKFTIKRVRIYSIPTKEEVEDYLKRKYGQINEHIDESERELDFTVEFQGDENGKSNEF